MIAENHSRVKKRKRDRDRKRLQTIFKKSDILREDGFQIYIVIIRYRWSGLYGALRSFTQENWSAVGVQSCLIFAIGSLSTQVSDYYLGRLLQQMSDNISIVSICLQMIVKFMGKKEQNNNIQDPRASSTGHLRNVQSLSTLRSNRQNQDVELSSVENIMRLNLRVLPWLFSPT
ncbi:hypothetical protein OOU_Y34scaffold00877g3 [Pyricularia oryzae Y34]|uniref:Uncharacterized protein n=1 Tax=Pyricularia oryzae (strain Y34) TaxID=1143189 RepID=A0AA97PGJ2_PYRO3|nr:hypothetical protein OOU_Y34scaffold00877g3 [Pyricularia oryzae Y34]